MPADETGVRAEHQPARAGRQARRVDRDEQGGHRLRAALEIGQALLDEVTSGRAIRIALERHGQAAERARVTALAERKVVRLLLESDSYLIGRVIRSTAG